MNTLSFASSSFFKSKLWTEIKTCGIPLCIVPSLDDMIAFPCFPQPPYKVSDTVPVGSFVLA